MIRNVPTPLDEHLSAQQGAADVDAAQLEPLCVSVTRAAELLGIGRNLAYELVAQGRIPSLRLGRRTVVPLEGLRRFVADQQR